MAKLLLQYVFQNKISYSYNLDQLISMKSIYQNIMIRTSTENINFKLNQIIEIYK